MINLHRKTYPVYWIWSDAVENHALLHGELTAVLGWRMGVTGHPNLRSLRNFPLQANGAEMLRLACIAATEQGIRVAAPVHDALLVEAPLDEIEDAVAATQEVMRQASECVLGGFGLRSDVEIFRYPQRYMSSQGESMWSTLTELLGENYE